MHGNGTMGRETSVVLTQAVDLAPKALQGLDQEIQAGTLSYPG